MKFSTKTIISAVAGLIISLQAIIIAPLVINKLGVENYGKYIIILSILSFTYGISSLGIDTSAKRWLPNAESNYEKSNLFYPQFWFQIISVTLLGAILGIIYETIKFYGLIQDYKINSWIFPLFLMIYAIYSQGADYFRYTHRTGYFNIITVFQSYLYLGAFIYITQFGWDLELVDLILLMTTTSLLVGTVSLLMINREIRIKLVFYSRKKLLDEIKIGFPTTLVFILNYVLVNGNIYIIGIMMSIKHVGLYAPAYAIGSLMIFIPKILGVVIPPQLSKKVDSNDGKGALKILDQSITIYLFVCIPYVVGAFLFGENVLQIYVGEEVAKSAASIVWIIAIATIFQGLLLIKMNILFVRMKIELMYKINLLLTLTNLGVNVVALFIFEKLVLVAVSSVITNVVGYVVIDKKLKNDKILPKININKIFYIIFCTTGIVCASRINLDLEVSYHALELLIKISLGSLLYIAMLSINGDIRKTLNNLLN